MCSGYLPHCNPRLILRLVVVVMGTFIIIPGSCFADERRHEVLDAEPRNEVLDTDSRDEELDADSRSEVPDASQRKEVLDTESRREVED